jgi:hypothetical protein
LNLSIARGCFRPSTFPDETAVKAAAAPAPAADEEEDLPPGPEPSTEDFSGSDVTLPYDALRKFLVAQELITSEFSGSPEELAQLVIDEAAHM